MILNHKNLPLSPNLLWREPLASAPCPVKTLKAFLLFSIETFDLKSLVRSNSLLSPYFDTSFPIFLEFLCNSVKLWVLSFFSFNFLKSSRCFNWRSASSSLVSFLIFSPRYLEGSYGPASSSSLSSESDSSCLFHLDFNLLWPFFPILENIYSSSSAINTLSSSRFSCFSFSTILRVSSKNSLASIAYCFLIFSISWRFYISCCSSESWSPYLSWSG